MAAFMLEGDCEGYVAITNALGRITDLVPQARYANGRYRRRVNENRLNEIIEAVTLYFNVPRDLLCRPKESGDGQQHIAFVRQVAMYLVRTMTDASFPAIGERFSRDHTTVMHACKLIAGRMAKDREFARTIEKLRDSLLVGREAA